MFFTADQGYRKPLMLKGTDSGPDQNVMALQAALGNLATRSMRPLINPGTPNGIVDDKTMQAVVSALDLVSEKLPTYQKLALQAALITGAGSSIARNAVATYAQELAVAANAAADSYTQQPAPIPAVVEHWYTKPYGIVIIVGVLLIGFRLFFTTSSARTANP